LLKTDHEALRRVYRFIAPHAALARSNAEVQAPNERMSTRAAGV